MPIQVQIRRAIATTQNARTLASGELDFDTTNNRLSPHDGSTAGGIPHINYLDSQENTYTYAVASGTNALTLTLAKAPASLADGLEVKFRAVNNNTGSVTLNVNSLGATTIKKTKNGSLANLEENDLVANAQYSVIYSSGDSSFILVSGAGGGGSFELIEENSFSGTSSNMDIEFTGITPSDYTSYKIVMVGNRATQNASAPQISFGNSSYSSTLSMSSFSTAVNNIAFTCEIVNTNNIQSSDVVMVVADASGNPNSVTSYETQLIDSARESATLERVRIRLTGGTDQKDFTAYLYGLRN